MELLADVERRDVRFAVGMRAGRDVDVRVDRVLEFLLSGLVISPIGDMTECSTAIPSGMVCGETVSLLRMLSALSVMALVFVGDRGGDFDCCSRVCDVVDSDVWKAVGETGRLFAVSLWVAEGSMDRFSCSKVSMTSFPAHSQSPSYAPENGFVLNSLGS